MSDTVRISRHLASPPDAVFRAWTEPDELAGWYGPAHLEVPRDSVRVDLRVGGRWELTMVRPGGEDAFPVGYEIVELEPPSLIVLRSDPMPGMPGPAVLRVELDAEDGGTRMTITDGPYPGPGREHAEAGWTAAFDALSTRLG